MQHSQSPNSEPEDWSDCQPGEIQGVVNSLRRQRRNKQLVQSATVGTSLVLLFAVALFSFPGLSGNSALKTHVMACHEVVQNAEDYVAGRLSNLVEQGVETHLSHCPRCREHIEALRIRFESDGTPAPVLQSEEFKGFELSLTTEPIQQDHNSLLASR